MPDQRVKGQDVSLSFVANGQVQEVITTFKDFDATLKFSKLKEGYLGEGQPRFDEIAEGIEGKINCAFANKGVFGVFQTILARAQRREPGDTFNIKATIAFPNGDRVRATIKNLFFGDIPITFASRDAYGNFSLDFSSDTITFV